MTRHMIRSRNHYLTLILLVFLLISCQSNTSGDDEEKANQEDHYVGGELPVQHGMELFNRHCASCHAFSENGIGPNLSGVTSEVSKEWLIAFIHNPPEMIESGDERSVKLFEKYKQYMPPFPTIEGKDMEDLLGFIHKFSEGERRSRNNRPGGLINPEVKKLDTSDLTLVLEEIMIIPPSSEASPITRINKMAPGPDGRLFIHDLRGQFYEIQDDRSLTTYLDLAKELPHFIDNPGKGTGFGSWDFHPEFMQNGLFYTSHNETPATKPADFTMPDSIRVTVQAVILEWKADDPEAQVFSGTHRELMRIDMYGGAHTAQELTFNPLATPGTTDYGLLYLGIGDASTALRGYTFLCDNIEHIWSSVIRFDPRGTNSDNGKYGIPPDNPFVGTQNALGEIWAHGFRNPHRISWDLTGSGKMFITNIGQHSVEEVNLGMAGANYGWPYREGTFLFDPDANPELVYPLPEDDTGYTYPVAQYDHDEGTAVSGGFVYAGSTIPELEGKYIFGDISRGTLFYTEVEEMSQGELAQVYRLNVALNGQPTDLETVTGNRRVDLRIGIDGDGELYIFTKSNGGIYQVVGVTEGEML